MVECGVDPYSGVSLLQLDVGLEKCADREGAPIMFRLAIMFAGTITDTSSNY